MLFKVETERKKAKLAEIFNCVSRQCDYTALSMEVCQGPLCWVPCLNDVAVVIVGPFPLAFSLSGSTASCHFLEPDHSI